MSSRVFQSVVLQLKESTSRTIGVIDANGAVVACSELSRIGETLPNSVEAISAEHGGLVVQNGNTFKTLNGLGAQFDYAVFTSGEDDLAGPICSMSAVALNGAKT